MSDVPPPPATSPSSATSSSPPAPIHRDGPDDRAARFARASRSLLGLRVGDALGAQFFVPENLPALRRRELPRAPWPWTDDTEMACAVYAELAAHGTVDQDRLAASFARHHDFDRGYGPTVNRMLRLVREGAAWRPLAAEPFEGQGSWGNGAAMRVAPLGAWFADDLGRAVREAAASAAVTHTHPEGIAGAVAVAAATALVCQDPLPARDFITAVRDHTPPGLVHDRLGAALALVGRTDSRAVGRSLGSGRRVSAPDTVPFTIWIAAHFPDDFAEALWATAAAGGDVDTTCAIVGGILGPRTAPPTSWADNTEPLPSWAAASVPPRPAT